MKRNIIRLICIYFMICAIQFFALILIIMKYPHFFINQNEIKKMIDDHLLDSLKTNNLKIVDKDGKCMIELGVDEDFEEVIPFLRVKGKDQQYEASFSLHNDGTFKFSQTDENHIPHLLAGVSKDGGFGFTLFGDKMKGSPGGPAEMIFNATPKYINLVLYKAKIQILFPNRRIEGSPYQVSITDLSGNILKTINLSQ